jgi:hypothetical protein
LVKVGGGEVGWSGERLTKANDTGVTPAQLQMEMKQVREVVDTLQEKVALFARKCSGSPLALTY